MPPFRTPLAFAAVAAFAFVLATGCQPKTDLGKTCVMIRKDPSDTDPSDGTRSIDIKEDDVVAGKDFISFGSTDCDDLVCVRDASDPKGPAGGVASGFCSRSCIPTSEATCLTGEEATDRSSPFSCRSLILDETTLAAIKQADPKRYQETFGDTQSPYFCAKPVPADGGTTP